MIAKKGAPLAIRWNGWCAAQYLKHIVDAPFQAPYRFGHDGKMESHMELVAVAKVRAHILRPLICFT